jgi:hypothetical protein
MSAPVTDVQSSGAGYGLRQASRAARSAPVKRATRAVHQAQPLPQVSGSSPTTTVLNGTMHRQAASSSGEWGMEMLESRYVEDVEQHAQKVSSASAAMSTRGRRCEQDQAANMRSCR